MTLQRYFHTSRQLRYSLLFALALLVCYEVLAAAVSGSAMAGVRNGADVLLKTLFVTVGGRHGLIVFGALLLGVGGWLVWRDHLGRRSALDGRVFAGMVLESVLLAAVFGQVVAYLTGILLYGPLAVTSQAPVQQLPLGTQLVVSLGAGIYEELVFRVFFVSGLLWLGLKLGWRRSVAMGVAVVASALIFSAFHYIGPFGDRFATPSFVFRTVAGLLLSGLYVTRGLGITAWTHALYDVGLSVLRG
jgi:hypothetical protein